MALTGLHLLLTYRCPYACDHCFVWSEPLAASKAMTLDEIDEILRQGTRLCTVETIFFEGGEPFLHYATLVQAVDRASRLGFHAGIVSNGFWASDVPTARKKLRPLVDEGLAILQLSADTLHGDTAAEQRVDAAAAAARELGLSPAILRTAHPLDTSDDGGSAVMYRGRAAVRLATGEQRDCWQTFTACPHEKLADPGRVHVDPFGYVHLCQGIVLGNLFERPLDVLVREYVPERHPIVGPLLANGPAGLVERYHLMREDGYADACHLCYSARRQLRPRFPEFLAPDQMYGMG